MEFVISPLDLSLACPFFRHNPLGATWLCYSQFEFRVSCRISDFGFSLPSAPFVLKSLRVP